MLVSYFTRSGAEAIIDASLDARFQNACLVRLQFVAMTNTARTLPPGVAPPTAALLLTPKLTVTWEDAAEEPHSEVKVELEANWRVESPKPTQASVFADAQPPPHEKRIFVLLKLDEGTQLDEISAKLEGEVSSSEIFSGLFELELEGKIKPLPGKNYARAS